MRADDHLKVEGGADGDCAASLTLEVFFECDGRAVLLGLRTPNDWGVCVPFHARI